MDKKFFNETVFSVGIEEDYCPSLPPHLIKETESKEDSLIDEKDLYCPPLPPHLVNKSRPINEIIGPSLPSYCTTGETSIVLTEENSESDEDTYIIGPVPSITNNSETCITRELKCQALKMKESLLKKGEKILARESWMLELPDDKPNLMALGLAPRKFSSKTPQERGDRSVWTDLPADKERKKQKREESRTNKRLINDMALQKRDEEFEKAVESYNGQKRSISLVDMHRKRKKGKNIVSSRRPFSREEDMQVNKIDEAQKATIMKKAALLDDRFSKGKQKFL